MGAIGMSHYEKRIEKDLTEIRDRVADLASKVEFAIRNAMDALLSGDEDKAYATVLGDTRINRESRDIDRLCHAFIARHLPSAGHLRLISSVLRTNIALERIGDYGVTISRESRQLKRPPRGNIGNRLAALSREAQQVLAQSVEGLLKNSDDIARATISMLSSLEPSMDGVYDELIASEGDRLPREMVALFVVFSLLKRVTDQAKNICEQTLFAARGETKEPSPARVLFLDQSNGVLSKLAVALADKNFPDAGFFASASTVLSKQPDPALDSFAQSHGLDIENVETRLVDTLGHDLPAFDVIVSLEGPVKEYMSMVPFHASAFRWDIGTPPGRDNDSESEQRYEGIYRSLMPKVEELMAALAGADS